VRCASPRPPSPWPLLLRVGTATVTTQSAKSCPDVGGNAVDPAHRHDLNRNRGRLVPGGRGTDAVVAMATIGPDGPTGTFTDRRDRVVVIPLRRRHLADAGTVAPGVGPRAPLSVTALFEGRRLTDRVADDVMRRTAGTAWGTRPGHTASRAAVLTLQQPEMAEALGAVSRDGRFRRAGSPSELVARRVVADDEGGRLPPGSSDAGRRCAPGGSVHPDRRAPPPEGAGRRGGSRRRRRRPPPSPCRGQLGDDHLGAGVFGRVAPPRRRAARPRGVPGARWRARGARAQPASLRGGCRDTRTSISGPSGDEHRAHRCVSAMHGAISRTPAGVAAAAAPPRSRASYNDAFTRG
jgi:hypothetical protein